jgi:phage tail sheath gpL-like
MAITFQNIPGNIRVPFFYGEVRAGVQGFQSDSKLLLIGLKADAGTAVAAQPVLVSGNEDALFGESSPLAQMVKAARLNAPFQTIYGLPFAQLGGGTLATGTITMSGPATRSAQGYYHIAGKRVGVVAVSGDTANTLATKVAAAINADTTLPVTANAVAAVVTLTAKLKGLHGNFLRIESGVLIDEDPLLNSLSAIVQMSGGAGDIDIGPGLTNLSDIEYDWIGLGFSDTVAVTAMENFLDDVSGRWGPYQQLYGHGFWAKDDTVANLSTLGNARNSQHATLFGQYKWMTPPYITAAVMAAIAAAHLTSAPEMSRPLHTLTMYGVMGPKLKSDLFTKQQRQTLYFDGVSAAHMFADGTMQVDRVLTSYQVNAWGSPDITFLDVNTPAQIMYSLRRLRADFTQKYGRASLADTNPYGIDSMVTPDDIRAEFIHSYDKLVRDGVLERLDLFEAGLQVERDVNDPNRVNASLPLDMVNQLRILAVAAVTFLQLQTA